MEIERIYFLISRKLAGEASETDILELNNAIKDDFKAALYLQIITDYWSTQSQECKGQDNDKTS